jgi:hypothetical protein
VEGSSYDLFEGTIWALAWKDWEKHEKPQDSSCPRRDSNRVFPKHKSEALELEPIRSVGGNISDLLIKLEADIILEVLPPRYMRVGKMRFYFNAFNCLDRFQLIAFVLTEQSYMNIKH